MAQPARRPMACMPVGHTLAFLSDPDVLRWSAASRGTRDDIAEECGIGVGPVLFSPQSSLLSPKRSSGLWRHSALRELGRRLRETAGLQVVSNHTLQDPGEVQCFFDVLGQMRETAAIKASSTQRLAVFTFHTEHVDWSCVQSDAGSGRLVSSWFDWNQGGGHCACRLALLSETGGWSLRLELAAAEPIMQSIEVDLWLLGGPRLRITGHHYPGLPIEYPWTYVTYKAADLMHGCAFEDAVRNSMTMSALMVVTTTRWPHCPGLRRFSE